MTIIPLVVITERYATVIMCHLGNFDACLPFSNPKSNLCDKVVFRAVIMARYYVSIRLLARRLSSRPKDGQFSEMGDFRRPVLGGHL